LDRSAATAVSLEAGAGLPPLALFSGGHDALLLECRRWWGWRARAAAHWVLRWAVAAAVDDDGAEMAAAQEARCARCVSFVENIAR
jgi:hypothetical protein